MGKIWIIDQNRQTLNMDKIDEKSTKSKMQTISKYGQIDQK